MLHPKPDKRYTLEKIEKSDWLNNTTEEELKIMQDRLDKSIEKTKQFREGNLLYWNSQPIKGEVYANEEDIFNYRSGEE